MNAKIILFESNYIAIFIVYGISRMKENFHRDEGIRMENTLNPFLINSSHAHKPKKSCFCKKREKSFIYKPSKSIFVQFFIWVDLRD